MHQPHKRSLALSPIFIADEDEWGRAMLGRALRGSGYQVVPCASAHELLLYLGDEATEAAGAVASVALVNSRTLGSQSTLDIIHALRAGHYHTRVVVLSSLSDEEDVIAFLRAGASDYVRVPAPPTLVEAAIERVLSLPLVG